MTNLRNWGCLAFIINLHQTSLGVYVSIPCVSILSEPHLAHSSSMRPLLATLSHDRSLSLSWSAQAATTSRQVWCKGLPTSNPYPRYLLSRHFPTPTAIKITSPKLLPEACALLQSHDGHLFLTDTFRRVLMQTSSSLHPTDLVQTIFFLLHLPSWPSPHPPLEPKHLPFTEVPDRAPCSRPVLIPSA